MHVLFQTVSLPTPNDSIANGLAQNLVLTLEYLQDFIKEDEMDTIKLHLHKLEGLVMLSQRIKQSCDSAFLYWNRNMIPVHLKEIYTTPEHAHKLHVSIAPFFYYLGAEFPVFHFLVSFCCSA